MSASRTANKADYPQIKYNFHSETVSADPVETSTNRVLKTPYCNRSSHSLYEQDSFGSIPKLSPHSSFSLKHCEHRDQKNKRRNGSEPAEEALAIRKALQGAYLGNPILAAGS